MTENAIEIRNLSKSFRVFHEKRSTLYEHLVGMLNRKKNYEKLNVLDNVSFDVKKGEMIGIIGKNGEGKTTLLRILSGIFKPDSGSVKVNGSITSFLELGSGFQPELTAVDNVILYGILLGFTRKEMKEKLQKILEFAELEKFADTKLKNFSSGMYARLAFATAIQVDPDILLVDEVLSVGDVPFQEKSFQTFLAFKKKGKTIVFVTHNLAQVQRLCDRAIFLMNGKIRKIGNPNEVVNEFYNVVDKEKAITSNVMNLSSPNNDTQSIVRRVDPTGITANMHTNAIYVTSISSDFVAVIDGNSDNIVDLIEVEAAPRDVTFNSITDKVYVINRDSDSVSVIDSFSNKVIKTHKVGYKPRGIAIDENKNFVYVANRDSNSMTVIDENADKIISNIEVGKGPQGIAVDQKTGMVFVANTLANSVSIIDSHLNKVVAEVPVGLSPTSVAVNSRIGRVYVTNRESNSISVIDGQKRKIIDGITVGNSPFGVVVNELTHDVLVTNSGTNTLTKIDDRTNKVIAVINVGNFPLGLTVNPLTNKIYVCNQAADSVSIVDGSENFVIKEIRILSKMASPNIKAQI